jgi:hypothetical protein
MHSNQSSSVGKNHKMGYFYLFTLAFYFDLNGHSTYIIRQKTEFDLDLLTGLERKTVCVSHDWYNVHFKYLHKSCFIPQALRYAKAKIG